MCVNQLIPPNLRLFFLVHCGISNAGNDKGMKTYNIFQLDLKGYFFKAQKFLEKSVSFHWLL